MMGMTESALDSTQRDTPRGDPALAGRLSRRRLCGGALTLAGTAPVVALIAACGGDDDTSGDATAEDTDLPGRGEGPVMYATPSCGCCANYAPYLRSNGHRVEVRHLDDLSRIKTRAGIPAEAEGCHTTMIDGYAIEGHVPVEAIDKLLRERPAVDGIALPGMPAGSPGMSGTKEAPFEILSITDGALATFMTI
jgi:hypothetical protein